MTKQWKAKPRTDKLLEKQLAEALGVQPLIAQLLLQRGISDFDTAKRFFRPQMNELYNPFLMADMDKAVARLSQAIENKENVLVYGDYDVDGTTAVALVYSFLKGQEVSCKYYIPDRYAEGYGFSFAGVDFAEQNDISLIITLDCGIKDSDKIKYAAEKGIDVIICDHHQVPVVPPALAVLDPQRKDCDYPFKGLSGCGVGFKLLQAYCISKDISQEHLYQYLDLLAISIGADIVPLIDENRVLAYYGLEKLAESAKRPGIQAMLESSGFKKSEITISDLVFILAPRINAAGRMVNGTRAVELLLAETLAEAQTLSPNLEDINLSRKEFDRATTAEALQLIEQDEFYKNSYSTVVANEGWHKGVVGIVASRLIEKYYKPTIVLVDDGEKMSGSARSIQGIDLFDVLNQCADLLEQFGGHTMAAGLSLKSENFLAFRNRFDEVVSHQLGEIYPMPFLEFDADMRLDEITPKLYRIIKQFAPFGPGNMRPVFLSRNIVNANYTKSVGETGTHLKLHIKHAENSGKEVNGIAFDMGHWAEYIKMGGMVDVLFSIEENTYNGATSLQLMVRDIKKSGEHKEENPVFDAADSIS